MNRAIPSYTPPRLIPSKKKLIGDTICMLVITTVWIVFEFVILISPAKRGFFCNDLTIRQAVTETSDTRLNDLWFRICFILGPSILIALLETVLYYWDFETVDRHLFYNIYKHLTAFIFGCSMCLVLVRVVKLASGQLGPDFIKMCRPSSLNCSSVEDIYKFNLDYECRAEGSPKLWSSKQSFPSSNAMLSMLTMFYLSLYLQVKLRFKGVFLIRHTLQIVFIGIAIWVGCTRITDHKNFLSDVIIGMIAGIVAAGIIAYYMVEIPPMIDLEYE